MKSRGTYDQVILNQDVVFEQILDAIAALGESASAETIYQRFTDLGLWVPSFEAVLVSLGMLMAGKEIEPRVWPFDAATGTWKLVPA